MINVDAEVSKYRNCKDRDELGRHIKEYKDLALQHASDIMLAGQYSRVASKLQEICDKLPAPNLKGRAFSGSSNTPTKTAKISKEEKAKIDAAWRRKAGS